jgi:hypothetical protein
VDGTTRRQVSDEYICTAFLRGRNVVRPTRCITTLVATTIDRAVLEGVERDFAAFERPDLRAALELAWERGRREARGDDDVAPRIARLEQRLVKWNGARASAYADWKAGEISCVEFQQIRARAAGEAEDCERELTKLRARLHSFARSPRKRVSGPGMSIAHSRA